MLLAFSLFLSVTYASNASMYLIVSKKEKASDTKIIMF